MTCAPAVSRQLKAVPGVTEAMVDFKTKTATVTVIEGTPTQAVLDGVKGQYSAKIKN